MKEKAIELIALIEQIDAEYDTINAILHKAQGDFSSHIEIMNHKIYSAVMRLVDDILGNSDIGSYYLFECRSMKGGGAVYEGKKKYPIRNIEDLRVYVMRDEK